MYIRERKVSVSSSYESCGADRRNVINSSNWIFIGPSMYAGVEGQDNAWY